jgi:fumarate hydratase subunit alpha
LPARRETRCDADRRDQRRRAAGYEKGLLRKSVVAEPLRDRVNTKTNTPAIVHLSIVPGDKLKITFMAKGGGCENKSLFKMFNPTESREKVADWIVDVVKNAGPNACPPYVVGVGLGGNFELAASSAKKPSCVPSATRHADPYYADMERSLLTAVNATGIGPRASAATPPPWTSPSKPPRATSPHCPSPSTSNATPTATAT